MEQYINLCLAIAALVLLWSSCVRTALSELTWGAIRKIDGKEKKLEQAAEKWMENKSQYKLILHFITLFSILFITTLVSAHLLSKHLTTDSFLEFAIILGCTFIFTFISKILAFHIQNSCSWGLLRLSMPIVINTSYLFFPLTLPLRYITRLQEKTAAEDDDRATVEDEILSLVEQDAHDNEEENSGSLEADERKMIQSIFDLNDTLVREIMTPRVDVKAASIDSSLDDVRDRIINSGHSRLPIYKESIDNIAGIIYAKDLLDLRKTEGKEVKDILHKPSYIPETKNIADLLDEFRENKQHLAVIIDEYGGTSGIVTIEDIIEEIVGEIQDEYDSNEVLIVHKFNADGSIVLEGRFHIDEFNELLDANLEEDEDYDTIAGYITSCIGKIPETGEVLNLDGLLFTILQADERKITKVEVSKADEPESSSENTGK